jgi:hypothetical protein
MSELPLWKKIGIHKPQSAIGCLLPTSRLSENKDRQID